MQYLYNIPVGEEDWSALPRNIAASELNIVPETRLLVLLEVEGVAERLRRDRALDALAMLVILLVEVRLPPAVVPVVV